MIVDEIRKAVIDTFNFIIPPFAKLATSLLVAYYITYGKLTDYWFTPVGKYITHIDLAGTKLFIDKLYLSSVMPIVFILILIALAYLINRTTGFIGSLIPFTFITSNQLVHHYATAFVWGFFPGIKSIDDLELKINQVVEKLRIENNSPYLDNLKSEAERRGQKFSYLNFGYFLAIFSIVSFWGTKKYIAPALDNTHLWQLLMLLLVIIIGIFSQIAYHFYRTVQLKLMIVESWIKSENSFALDYNEIPKEITERLDTHKKYNKRWWSVSLGYRVDWLAMYKYYRLRPPFYNLFMKWKYERNRK